MRRHATLMHQAIRLAQTGPTEEQRQEFKINLLATFNEAQSAWNTYREHLIEHGVLRTA
jgi:hypothetical protein